MEVKISDILAARFNEANKVADKPAQEEFSFVLSKMSDGALSAKLHSLIGSIAETGKKIVKHVNINDMRDYRRLIKDFINEVVTNSHRFSRENFLDRRGRHRVYGIIQMVNKDLDELAQELLKAEKDHLAILDKINEIEGLLLDILA